MQLDELGLRQSHHWRGVGHQLVDRDIAELRHIRHEVAEGDRCARGQGVPGQVLHAAHLQVVGVPAREGQRRRQVDQRGVRTVQHGRVHPDEGLDVVVVRVARRGRVQRFVEEHVHKHIGDGGDAHHLRWGQVHGNGPHQDVIEEVVVDGTGGAALLDADAEVGAAAVRGIGGRTGCEVGASGAVIVVQRPQVVHIALHPDAEGVVTAAVHDAVRGDDQRGRRSAVAAEEFQAVLRSAHAHVVAVHAAGQVGVVAHQVHVHVVRAAGAELEVHEQFPLGFRGLGAGRAQLVVGRAGAVAAQLPGIHGEERIVAAPRRVRREVAVAEVVAHLGVEGTRKGQPCEQEDRCGQGLAHGGTGAGQGSTFGTC